MHKIILGSAMVLVLFGTACGHKHVKYDSSQGQTSQIGAGTGVEMHVDWLKVKKNKVEVSLAIENTSNQNVRITSSAIHLNYNGETVGLTLRGDLVLALQGIMGPGNSVRGTAYFTFSHAMAETGTATVIVDPIFTSVSDEPGKENWTKIQPIKMQLAVH